MDEVASSLRIFCFPQAGADASIFKAWESLFTTPVETVPVTLPGRGVRLDDTPPTDLEGLCDALFDELRPNAGKPFALLGSSMGGWIAYELAWRFEQIDQKPDFVLALTSPAPDQPRHLPELRDKDRIAADLLDFNPHFKELMQYPELLELLLPTIVNDFRMCSAYQPADGRIIETDIYAVAGDRDGVTSVENMRPWAAFTNGRFELKVIDGEHNLHENPSSQLRFLINNIVARGIHANA